MNMLKLMSLATLLAGMLTCSGGKYTNLDADAFERKLSEEGITLVDVRTADEYDAGHIPGAGHVDWYAADFLRQMEAAYPKETPLAVYCRSGRRSAEASARLAEAGYSVFNLRGGYIGWTAAGKKVTRYEVETFRTGSGAPLAVTLIKHGTLALEYKGVSIHVDPVAAYGKPTDYAAEFPKADIILITHEHGDHLDEAAIRALEKEGTRILVSQAVFEKTGRGEVMHNGDSRETGGIRIDAVPAYNTTPGREKFHPKGAGNGYLLTVDGLRIYVAGDTEDIPELAGLKDIDVAFLPVNQPYTMTVDQCVRAAQTIAPKVLIPYHFGQTDLSGLQERLPGMKVLIRQMQ